jgi:hypothetical protein
MKLAEIGDLVERSINQTAVALGINGCVITSPFPPSSGLPIGGPSLDHTDGEISSGAALYREQGYIGK